MLTYEENNIGHNINPKVQPVLCGACQVISLGDLLTPSSTGSYTRTASRHALHIQYRGQVGGGDCGIRPVSPVHGCF